MSMSFNGKLDTYTQSYGYVLPPDAIALAPARPRDRARLLVNPINHQRQLVSAFKSVALVFLIKSPPG